MARLLIPFLGCEGPNDRDFLLPLLRKVFQRTADAEGHELLDVFLTEDYVLCSAHAQQPFTDWVRTVAEKAEQLGDGDAIVCIHVDADSDAELALAKIAAARQAVDADGILPGVRIVAVVPARTIEGWVLADPRLLCEKLNPDMSAHQLNLATDSEGYPNPKEKLHETHRLAHADRRRRQPARVEVGDLYGIIGADIDPQKLGGLPSFSRFTEELAASFRQLGYLR